MTDSNVVFVCLFICFVMASNDGGPGIQSDANRQRGGTLKANISLLNKTSHVKFTANSVSGLPPVESFAHNSEF